MRKLLVTTFLSLDGVMQAPGGPDEDTTGGFTYGGWMFPLGDDVTDAEMSKTMSSEFDLLLGRKTYDIFAPYWPTASDGDIAAKFNAATKYVASRGNPALTWENSVLIEGNVAEGVAAIKEQDGPELQVHGSGNLVQTLLQHGLVDELRLWVFPVMLGSGKRLLAEGTRPGEFELVDNVVSTTGVVIGTYRAAGEVRVGSFSD